MTSRRSFLGISYRRWALLAAVATGLFFLSLFVRGRLDLAWSVESLRAFVATAGPWGPVVYVAILVFRFAVLVPSSILLTGAGICFGAAAGTLYAAIGLTLSAMFKFAIATIAGRDVLLRQLPDEWRSALAVGDRRATTAGLALICAYPFGPKHVFQIAAILSGMSFWKYALAVSGGAGFRAGAFALLGEALATGEGIVLVSALLLGAAAVPLTIPGWRAWLLASERAGEPRWHADNEGV